MDTSSQPAPGRGRRRWAAALLVSLGVIGLGLFLVPRFESGPPATRPNIILVVWDTCRGDRVSAGGYARPTAPHLEAIAAGGVTFLRCFTPAPWTPPAHASLFTGLLPRRHGLIEGMGDRVHPGLERLPETLAKAGYETVLVSANPLLSTATGLNRGFEVELPCFRTEDGSGSGEDALARVVEWLGRHEASRARRRPVFLVINLMDSHLPYVYDAEGVTATHGAAAREGARRAAETVGDMDAKLHLLGVRRLGEGILGQLSTAYDGAVRRNDRTTARILDLLGIAGITENAFLAVCSDHGENLGEHGEMNHAFSVHAQVSHVPLVVRWKGRFEGGRREETPVALQDLYPTILGAAGLSTPQGCGTDAIPLDAPVPGRVIVSEYGPMLLSLPEAKAALRGAPPEVLERFGYRYRAARTWSPEGGGRTWIGVDHPGEGGTTTLLRESLFDLVLDPAEEKDLLEGADDPDLRATALRLREKAGE